MRFYLLSVLSFDYRKQIIVRQMGIALFFLLSSMISSNNSKDQAVINAVTASMIVMQLLITVALVYSIYFQYDGYF